MPSIPNSNASIRRGRKPRLRIASPCLDVCMDQSPDAELLTLERDIAELVQAAQEILSTRVEPHDDAFERAWRISNEHGRSTALRECKSLLHGADLLFARMRQIEARTQEGRKAKVRALLICVLGADWRGPAIGMDYETQVTRELLGELAGMSAAEIEAV